MRILTQIFFPKDSKSSRLSRSSSKRNDDQGGPTTSNPVNTGSRPKRSNNQQTKYQDAEVENSDDDTDEEEDAKKGSRKFFKATEKERVSLKFNREVIKIFFMIMFNSEWNWNSKTKRLLFISIELGRRI